MLSIIQETLTDNYRIFYLHLLHIYRGHRICLISASFRSSSASGENLFSKDSAAAALNYNSSSSLLKTAVQSGSKTNNSNTNSNSTGGKQKKRIKAAVSNSTYYFWDAVEWTSTLVIMNFSFYMSVQPSTSFFMFCFYIAIGNIVVGRTLILRNERIPESAASILNEKDTGKEKLKQSEKDVTGLSSSGVGVGVSVDSVSAQKKMMLAKGYVAVGNLPHDSLALLFSSCLFGFILLCFHQLPSPSTAHFSRQVYRVVRHCGACLHALCLPMSLSVCLSIYLSAFLFLSVCALVGLSACL